MMTPDRRYLHCRLSVCELTPLVTGDSAGVLYVKYYAHGNKDKVECRTSIHEWHDLVKSGRIRKANDPALPTASANL